MIHGQAGDLESINRTWDDSLTTWSQGDGAPLVSGTVKWTVNKVSPSGDREMLGILGNTGSGTDLRFWRWDGTAWVLGSSSTAITSANADKRGFDVAYESLSDGMKNLLDGLVAVHSDAVISTPENKARQNNNRSTELMQELDVEVVENEHPVVRTHPETGCSFAISI